MPHIVSIPTPTFASRCGFLHVHQVPAATDNLIWLIEYKKGHVAAVDGPSFREVRDYCSTYNLILDTIINTHTHADHIGINRDLQKQGLLTNMRVIGSLEREKDIPGITETVSDGDRVQLGEVTGIAMQTDGHINGHISYVFSDLLFCGDTLFTGGCGYLFDGPPKAMYESLQRLRELPSHTKVCCAHEYTQDNLLYALSIEPQNTELRHRYLNCLRIRQQGGCLVPSTIALEKSTNPFLRWENKEIIQHLKIHYPNMDIQNPADIFACIRKRKDSKAYKKP